jgi:hypothetical protein
MYLARGFLPLFWQHDVNVLEGISVDADKSFIVARLMKSLLSGSFRVGSTAVQGEDVINARNEKVGYFTFDLDTNPW